MTPTWTLILDPKDDRPHIVIHGYLSLEDAVEAGEVAMAGGEFRAPVLIPGPPQVDPLFILNPADLPGAENQADD